MKMPELIDKKRTEAKVFLLAILFIDRPDREVDLVKAVIHRCCEEIDKHPTIEAEPVRHGRWIKIEPSINLQSRWKCSRIKCGGIVHAITYYCPNCGARMDGKERD